MFAYCENNPIHWIDNDGHSIKDFFEGLGKTVAKYVAKNIVKPGVHAAKKVTSYLLHGTISVGRSCGVAFGPAHTNGGGYAFDGDGNLSYYVYGGGGGGFPSASIERFFTYTTAPNVDKLNGHSFQTGGSIGAGPALGAEGVMVFDKDEGTAYLGYTVSVGGAVNIIPFEIHTNVTKTKTIWKFNVFEIIEKECDRIAGLP